MAISYIVGIPGSGKTYYAVYKIYKEFLEEPKKTLKEKIFKLPPKEKIIKYENLYCNINQFKYEKSNKFFPFNSSDFYEKLKFLYNIYLSTDGKDDDILIERAKNLQIYKSLIVIDECHNFLNDKEDIILKWWLTYHRHLYQDIILITQDLSLISTGYKSIAEYFYKAMPSALRLFKSSFRYLQFTSYKLYSKDIISKKGIHIPIIKDIFYLYHSGDKTSNKSIMRKFLYISITLFFITCISFYLFINYLKSYDEKEEKIDNKEIINKNKEEDNINKDSNFKKEIKSFKDEDKNFFYIYKFYCVENFCNLDGEKEFISQKIIRKIIDKKEIYFFQSYDSFENFRVLIYYLKNPVFDFLKGVSKNEKNNNISDFSYNNMLK